MAEMLVPATNRTHLPAADIFVGAVTRIVADRDEHGNWVIGVTVPGPDVAHGARLHTTTFWHLDPDWSSQDWSPWVRVDQILNHMIDLATRKAHQ